uniref:Uncharacterized protein n=1 Tax=Oryza nivara TaxID=4536 RepID=A0A0E0J1L1_ORYNI
MFEPPNAGLMKIGWEDDLGPLLSFLPPDLAEEERLRRPLLLPPNAAATPRRYSGRDCAVGPPSSFLPPDLVEGMALSGHTPTTPTLASTHAANDADTDASAPPTALPAARRGEEKGREEKRRCAVEKRKEEKRPRERERREKDSVSLIRLMRPGHSPLSAPQAARLTARSKRCRFFLKNDIFK